MSSSSTHVWEDRKRRRSTRFETAIFPPWPPSSPMAFRDSWDAAATRRRRSRKCGSSRIACCTISARLLTDMKSRRIIVVGAGPVGVVAALACAQKGFAVTVIESESKVDDSPRAATTHPVTLQMIDRLGLIEPFIAQGLVARYFHFWDRPSRTRIAEFDHDLLRGETRFPFVVQTEQHKLANMGLSRLREYADSDIRFETRVTAVRQDAGTVIATAEGPNGIEEFGADFLIGADGGRSTIRKALDIEFEE